MNLYKSIIIFVASFFVVGFADTASSTTQVAAPSSAPAARSQSPVAGNSQKSADTKVEQKKDTPADDLNSFFRQQMNDGKLRLEKLKSLFPKIPLYLKKVTYDGSSRIEILDTDPVDPTEKLGLVIDFGDAGHGALAGFDGFKVDIVIQAIPDFLLDTFAGAIKDAIAPLFNGRSFRDATTKLRVLKSAAAYEFIFKMILLVNDFARKEADPLRIDLREFNVEMLLLMFRLSQTSGIKNIADVFSQIPEPLKNIVQQVKIKTQTARDYISSLWKNYLSMANYNLKALDGEWTTIKASLGADSVDALGKWSNGEPLDAALFDKMWDDILSKQKPVWGAKDTTKILEALSAVALRAVVDYTKAKDKFSLTDAGKAAEKILKETEDTDAFNKKIPAFKDMKKSLLIRFMIIASKVDGFMALQNRLLERVRPVVDELLAQFGMQLDALFPREKDKSEEELEAEAISEEFENALAQDALFGEDLEEFEYVEADSGIKDVEMEEAAVATEGEEPSLGDEESSVETSGEESAEASDESAEDVDDTSEEDVSIDEMTTDDLIPVATVPPTTPKATKPAGTAKTK